MGIMAIFIGLTTGDVAMGIEVSHATRPGITAVNIEIHFHRMVTIARRNRLNIKKWSMLCTAQTMKVTRCPTIDLSITANFD